MLISLPATAVTSTICPRATEPSWDHPPSHQLQLPPLPADETYAGSLCSVIARNDPAWMPSTVTNSIFAEPATEPLEITRGRNGTLPEPRAMTASPDPVAFRMVRPAPAPRRVTCEGMRSVPAIM